MGFLLYFITLLALFMSAFIVTVVLASGRLDRLCYTSQKAQGNIKKGDFATISAENCEITAIVEDVCYDEDNLTKLITLRYIR